jgi:molybdopterin molybdotransferase
MITVLEALESVLRLACPLATRAVGLDGALGLVLAEDVTSDVDSPPYDKTLVDGYAVVAKDVSSGARELQILEEIVAGLVPTQPVRSGTATRLMTGAPIPDGADAVVMLEETELIEVAGKPPQVRIRSPSIKPAQNILRRGVAMRKDDVVLRSGRQLQPSDIGLLAEVGRESVPVIRRPRVAILSTGNELVPASQTPGPGQIRNSNSPMLAAMAASAGGVPRDLGIARDEREELKRRIVEGLEDDVLLLSGGVSAGVLDLVPGVLAELGVEQVFHKVQLKPGKPLWFGTKRRAESGERRAMQTLVFGLPGNPVSTFVCFELFVRPALRKLAGLADVVGRPLRTRLAADFTHKGNRPTYHPARWREEDDGNSVETIAWQGSADLRALASANALIHFVAGDRKYLAGDMVEVYRL